MTKITPHQVLSDEHLAFNIEKSLFEKQKEFNTKYEFSLFVVYLLKNINKEEGRMDIAFEKILNKYHNERKK